MVKVHQEAFYGRPVIVADREMVEMHADDILSGAAARKGDGEGEGAGEEGEEEVIAFLVVGDPFGATTHVDLALRARQLGIRTRTIHNASIMNAIGSCGLQLYNFGQTVSMVFFTDSWRPTSFYDRVRENRDVGLHTLILLDIKVKEPSLADLARGRKGVFEPPRFMTAAQCAAQMLEVEAERAERGLFPTITITGPARRLMPSQVYSPNSLALAVARLGSEDQTVVSGTLEQLSTADLGKPLHSLVLLGKRVHQLEIDFIREFAIDEAAFTAAHLAEYGP